MTDYAQTQTDALGLADTQTQASAYERAQTDNLGITDSHATRLDKTHTDTLGITERSSYRTSTLPPPPSVEDIFVLPTSITFGQAEQPRSAFRTQYGKTYDFDFSTGQFVDNAGSVALIDRIPSLTQALTKLLLTKRYADLAYDGNYGNDAWNYLATTSDTDEDIRADTLAHYCIEALLNDERVAEVRSCTVVETITPNELEIEAEVVDTFGAATTLTVTLQG